LQTIVAVPTARPKASFICCRCTKLTDARDHARNPNPCTVVSSIKAPATCLTRMCASVGTLSWQ